MNHIDEIINNTSLVAFWGDVDKVEIPILNNPLCITESYHYYIQAKLLIRTVNKAIVGYAIGEKASLMYREIGGEIFITTKYLLEYLSNVSGFKVEQIVSKSQKEELVCCRQLIMWHYVNLAKDKTIDSTLSEIGSIFNKDHATIIHAFKSIEEEDKYKKAFQVKYKHKFVHHLIDSYSLYQKDKYKQYHEPYKEIKNA